jgi:hypothetical protein
MEKRMRNSVVSSYWLGRDASLQGLYSALQSISFPALNSQPVEMRVNLSEIGRGEDSAEKAFFFRP